MKTNVFYHGDCLFVMQHDIPTESVDLIYLDPPFYTGEIQKASEGNYLFKWNNVSFNSKKFIDFLKTELNIEITEQAKFSKSNDDTTLTISGNTIVKIKLDKEGKNAYLNTEDGKFLKMRALKQNDNYIIMQQSKWNPGAMEISFDDSKKFWGDSEKVKEMRKNAPEWLIHIAKKRPQFASYLYYMMERVIEFHRVLKPTGSIYFHCDRRASHYLKMIMDEIFGYESFRNEIIWHYFMGGKPKKYWANKHDAILFYSKGTKWTFNPQKWKRRLGFKPSLRNETKGSETGQDKFGYYSTVRGDDVWDIGGVFNMSNEYVNYPTQKPSKLLERIIEASSNEGDVVLDPFCGCGTTVIAAHNLNRNWIGVDINEESFDTIGKICNQTKILNPMKTSFVERTLESVSELDPLKFEQWVNDFYGATKPSPDRGVDGITKDGIPIQTKTFKVGYNIVSEFLNNAKYHPDSRIVKPLKNIILVSQKGFDDSARQRAFEIETGEGINIELIEPKDMLKTEDLTK